MSTPATCGNCGKAMHVHEGAAFDRHDHNDSQWCTAPGGTKAEAVTDNFDVAIEVGDVVRILSWGAPVRLTDCGRAAVVTGFTRTGNVTLDGAPFGHAVDRIANGRAVRPGHLGVLDRSDKDNRVAAGYEGNRDLYTKAGA